jgi:hypothetical protein
MLHQHLLPKHGKGFVQEPEKKEVVDERVGQVPKIQEEAHEEDFISTKDVINKEKLKEEHPLEWFGKRWISFFHSLI